MNKETGYPLITIGQTAYNCADTIIRALESGLAQDWPNIEIVVVDDVSSDNTGEIIRKYAESHPNIRYFRQEKNGGVAVTRNRIIKEAAGEFICFFDDDDAAKPERVRMQYERIIECEKQSGQSEPIVLCHCAREHVYPGQPPVYVPTVGMDKNLTVPSGEAVAERILTGKPVVNGYGSAPTCVQMARKSVYERLGGFDDHLRRGEDTDLCIRAALAGGYFPGVSDVLVTQYMTLTPDKGLAKERELWRYILDKYKDRLDKWGMYGFCCGWIEAKFMYMEGKKKDFFLKMLMLMLRYPVKFVRRLVWSLPSFADNRRFGKWRRTQEKV